MLPRDIIENGDVCEFTVDPEEGDTVTIFKYVSIDQAGLESEQGMLLAPFSVPSISGVLYLDTNHNEFIDGNTTSKSCDTNTTLYVNLVGKTDNKVIAASEFDPEDGSYVFHNPDVKPNSSYELILSQIQGQVGDTAPEADLPDGCMFMGENIGVNTENPEGTKGDGKISVDLQGVTIPELNFGISPSVKIGNKVWIEDDNDGDATTGTITPVGGVTVTATCGDKEYTAITNSNGEYEISVPSNIGDCKVKVDTPANTLPAEGSDDNRVEDTVSEENKTHDGSGTTVVVGTKDNMTVDFGFTPPVVPNVHIGDLVWIEDDNDGDAATGTITYPPVGTEVTATAPDGTVYTGTTDANGHYDIEVPANDTYTVTIATPEGSLPTKGSDDKSVPDDNSENSISHDGAGTTVVVGTTDNMTVDFGFIKEEEDPVPMTTAIGNLFWIDDNANGIVDNGEKGYNGVKVTLFDDNGNVLDTQTTRNGPDGKPGYYLFDNLTPGQTYQVHFDYSDVPALEDYVYSPSIGGNNANNADDRGFTVSVTPQAGQQILTIDAGINCGCSHVSSDGSDALGVLGMLAMMLMTLITALFFVRKEEQRV
jgi:hypothetical protein